MRYLLCCALLIAAAAPRAEWFGFCATTRGEPRTGQLAERVYRHVDGRARTIVISRSELPDCNAARLELDGAAIRWLEVVAQPKSQQLGAGLILQGVDRGDTLAISEIVPVDAAVGVRGTPDSLPLRDDLLDRLERVVFGREERAGFRERPDGLALRCRGGRAPAGLLLSAAGPLPPGAELALEVEYRAQGPFEIGLSDARRVTRDDPLPLGELNPAGQKRFDIPAERLAADAPLALTIACPAQPGELSIRRIRLEPRVAAARPSRAVWVWQTARWQRPDALLDSLDADAADLVYISVAIEQGRVLHATRLGDFIAAAGARGISVWAVEGDPDAVLPAGRAVFVERARALRAYNAAVPVEQRLAGIQYDIEPYLIPGYHLEPVAYGRAYLQTIEALAAAGRLPIELALPFWWSSLQVDDVALLDRLAASVSGVAVMNYRTELGALQRQAEPFLDWGVRHGRSVRIGLEAGPIADETRWHFRRAERGTLWQVPLGGGALLVLLDAPAANPHGPSFALTHESVFSGSTVSFAADRAALDALIPELERIWSAWPSFAGLALHEYL